MDEVAQVRDRSKALPNIGSDRHDENSRVKTLVYSTSSEELQTHYRRDYQSLVNRSRSIVRSSETAEDIVQEAFSQTVSAIRHGTEIREMGPYLNSCVRNLSLRFVKRKAMLPLDEDVSFARGDSTDELVHRRQQYEAVCKAMSGLAPAQKSALYLAEIRGMAYSEIADSMHKQEGAVRQLISRARTRVRETAGPRALTIALPLLLEMDAEARRGLPYWIQVRVLFTRTRIKIFAKITELRRSVGTLLGSPADLVSQPATAFLVGALVITALAVSEQGENSSDQFAEKDTVSKAVSKADSGTIAADLEKHKGDSSASDSSLPASEDDPLVSYIPPSLGSVGGGGSGNVSDDNSARHGDSKGTTHESDEPPDDGGGNPETSPVPAPTPGTGGSGIAVPVSTAAPSISGNPYVGQTLSVSSGSWSNDPTTLSYQWLRNGAVIAGATNSTYTLVAADAGNTIGVTVTAANAGGSATATSGTVTAIGVPVYTNGSSTVSVVGGGPPVAGAVIICGDGVWTNSPTSIVPALRRDGVMILPAPTNPYTLVAADIGSTFDCVITATNLAGSEIAITDAFTTP